MNLMSGWHAASVHPSETIVIPEVGHDDLIGFMIFPPPSLP